ncbi:hypothetical protein BgiBS90_003651 [Biomphalaria glabrata]|nr:hypothetical protein BgiBS90_003651 [Biomphalaria glabrata]
MFIGQGFKFLEKNPKVLTSRRQKALSIDRETKAASEINIEIPKQAVEFAGPVNDHSVVTWSHDSLYTLPHVDTLLHLKRITESAHNEIRSYF